jgi:ABC-type dipeptide/oligopeptide/nickel transport system ATPase component
MLVRLESAASLSAAVRLCLLRAPVSAARLWSAWLAMFAPSTNFATATAAANGLRSSNLPRVFATIAAPKRGKNAPNSNTTELLAGNVTARSTGCGQQQTKIRRGIMGLLKEATSEVAFLKMGIFGETGSGKTFTMTDVAIGLQKHIGSSKPIAFFDTEDGSDYVLPKMKKAGIKMLRHKGRAARDLQSIIQEATKECDILLIDSITHVWDEFTEAYRRQTKRKFIELFDWKPIKDDWRRVFRDPFLNSNLHIIMAGRAGAIYETVEEDRGGGQVKKTSVKAGTKMRAEADTGYEPSLLVEMTKEYIEGSGQYVRRAYVVKDRFDVIDSKQFDDPQFTDFLPYINCLNIGGAHSGVDVDRTSDVLFETPQFNSRLRQQQRDILIEDIKNTFIKAGLDGAGKAEKQQRLSALESAFKTGNWTQIEQMLTNEQLKDGLHRLQVDLGLVAGSESETPSVDPATVVVTDSDIPA